MIVNPQTLIVIEDPQIFKFIDALVTKGRHPPHALPEFNSTKKEAESLNFFKLNIQI